MSIKVRYLDPEKDREVLIHQYISALDTGNLDAISEVLSACQRDPELERMVDEVNDVMAKELGLNVLPFPSPDLPPTPVAT